MKSCAPIARARAFVRTLAPIPAALLGISGLSSVAFAQVDVSNPQLPMVVVTASRLEQQVQDALPATTLITRADIDRSQALDVPALLRQVSGVELAQSGGAGTVSSAFIRGAESRHTLVLVDGVAVNNLNFSTAALEHLPLANVERIEVVRGNVSSLYGSAALGGVIQIFTRQASDKPYASLGFQAGSRGLLQAQAGAGVKLESGTRLSFSSETFSENGFNAINQDKRKGTNPDLDGYSRRTVAVGISQDIGVGKVSLTSRETTGVTAYDSQFGPATQADESRFSLTATVLNGQFNLAPALVLDATASTSADKLRADVTAFPYYVNSQTDSASAGLRWAVQPGHNVTAGVESSTQRIEASTVYRGSSRVQDSLRLGYQGDWEQHQLQLNVRQDRYSDFGTASTWLAGYAWRFAPQWRANASTSTGFTAPTFNDLYYPFGGNVTLRPEQVRASELGLQYATDQMEARLVWFSNRFTDLIGNDFNFNRININQARNEGVELSYLARYGATQVRAGLTLQDPIDSTTGKRLDRRAATVANVGVNHDAGAWSYGADLRYSGERPDGSQTLASYSVLDLRVAYKLAQGVKLMGRVENVLDARYETAYGYNQAPFGVFVGVTWQP
jgi:vitamin B12 transporter